MGILTFLISTLLCIIIPRSGAGGMILTLLHIMGEVLSAIGFIGLLFTLSPFILLFTPVLVIGTFLLSEYISKKEYVFLSENSAEDRRIDTLLNFANESMNKKDILVFNLYTLIRSYVNRYIAHINLLMESPHAKRFRVETLIAGLDSLRDGTLYSWLIFQFLNNQIDASQFYLNTSGIISFVVIAQQSMINFTNNECNEKEIWKAITKVGLLDWVQMLPQRLATFLSQNLTREWVLPSEGQAQKIALARSIYQGGYFMIMDEPAADLDPRSEEDIFTQMVKLS